MDKELEIPEKYKQLVGTKQMFRGGLFSHIKIVKPEKFDVLNIRWGSATIVNMDQISANKESDYEYPTFELLLKNDSMKKSRWTRPFPIREINLKSNKEQKLNECDATKDQSMDEPMAKNQDKENEVHGSDSD